MASQLINIRWIKTSSQPELKNHESYRSMENKNYISYLSHHIIDSFPCLVKLKINSSFVSPEGLKD